MAEAPAPVSSADALSTCYYLVILLTHLGCFFLFSSSSVDQPPSTKHPPQIARKRRISPISCAFPQRDPPDSVTHHGDKDRATSGGGRSTAIVPDFVLRCSIKSLFSFHKPKPQSALPAHNHSTQPHDLAPPPDMPHVRTSSVGAVTTPSNAATTSSDSSDTARATPRTGVAAASAISSSHSSFSGRGDVHPCATCGDVFPRPHLLDLHHSARHAFADLPEADSGGGIVRIIFLSGWKPAGAGASPAVVRRVLRVRNPVRAMQRFEECRDAVRARAADRKAGGDGKDVGDLERCVADGNERLRFVGATYVCGGLEGKREDEGLGTCGSGMCRVCGIVRNGFGGKLAAAEEDGGVRTYATGWAAHTALSMATTGAEGEGEDELSFLDARKAVIVCRVVAGRVKVGRASSSVGSRVKEVLADGDDDDGSFDSAVVSGNAGVCELVVLNRKAVLPCFVILYSA